MRRYIYTGLGEGSLLGVETIQMQKMLEKYAMRQLQSSNGLVADHGRSRGRFEFMFRIQNVEPSCGWGSFLLLNEAISFLISTRTCSMLLLRDHEDRTGSLCGSTLPFN